MSSPKKTSKKQKTIYTIGHGTRSRDEVLDILKSNKISKLVDVRAFPNSRKNPQFNSEDFQAFLSQEGIDYQWMGDSLGGRKSKQDLSSLHTALRVPAFRNYAGYMATENWKAGIHQLCADSSHTMAYMCSETLWWRCHRRLLSDYLALHGWTVLHLGIKKNEPVEHQIWDLVRVTPDGMLVYDQN